MGWRVHIDGDHLDPDYLGALRREVSDSVALSVGGLPDDWPEVRCLVSGWPKPEHLDTGEALSSLVIPFSGPPARTLRLLQDRGLAVYNLHHNAQAVVEMALALLFACAKCVVPMDRDLRVGDWRARYASDPGLTLRGRRALVLGHGAIGGGVASALTALGLTVTAVARRARDDVRGIQELDALLPMADVLVLALPATEETLDLIDARRLGLLPSRAILVNVARAKIVEEDALFWALESGALHSAGLDVWYRYPKTEADRAGTSPATQPFEMLDNVVLSPHRAGHGPAVERLRGVHLAKLLGTLASGGTPETRVDLSLGY